MSADNRSGIACPEWLLETRQLIPNLRPLHIRAYDKPSDRPWFVLSPAAMETWRQQFGDKLIISNSSNDGLGMHCLRSCEDEGLVDRLSGREGYGENIGYTEKMKFGRKG